MLKVGQKVRITTKFCKRMDSLDKEDCLMLRDYGGTIMTVSQIKEPDTPSKLYYLMEEDGYSWSWFPEMIVDTFIRQSPKLPNI